MVWQPARLTRAQMEERRLAAARLLRAGELAQAEIARQMGVSRAAVTQWKQRLDRDGLSALRQRRSSGRPARLSEAQWDELLTLLQQGAVAAGFETERWTLRRIGRVIARTFGVRYHFRSLGCALHARGLRRDWPRIKRGRGAQGGRWPSWMRSATRFGPPSARLGRPQASRRCCDG